MQMKRRGKTVSVLLHIADQNFGTLQILSVIFDIRT